MLEAAEFPVLQEGFLVIMDFHIANGNIREKSLVRVNL
jgi:hypothetical protein